MAELKQGQKIISFAQAMRNKNSAKFYFEFAGRGEQKQNDGSVLEVSIIRLLSDVPDVLGSQKDADGNDMIAYGIETVRVREDVYDDPGFEIIEDEDGNIVSGKYEGKLFLDIAKSTGDVWLLRESFASVGRTFLADRRSQNADEVRKKLAGNKIASKMGSNGQS